MELADNAGVQSSDERPLEGQSPYVINAGLSFEPAEGKVERPFCTMWSARESRRSVRWVRSTTSRCRGTDSMLRFAKLGAGFKLGLKGETC